MSGPCSTRAPHQKEAIDAIARELETEDRCTAVMACGTGKTLTALRLAERQVGPGGTVLFLAPSISLVSQVMRNWVNQVHGKIHVYVVCSDGSASFLDEDGKPVDLEAYGQLSDVPFPATTSPETVAQRFKPKPDALNVIFSTYQSIDVIHQAQEKGLCGFDLAICDEAHRTTGVMDGEGAFQKIHDNNVVKANKRLYMTATPRIFGEDAKQKAKIGMVDLAGMDDPAKYGRIAYRLSFGQAVDRKLLTDYKIVVMQVSETVFSPEDREMFGAKDSEIGLSDAAKFIGVWKALFDRKQAKGVEDLMDRGKHADGQGDDATRPLHHAIAFCSTIKASKALTDKFNAVVRKYKTRLEEQTGEGVHDPLDVQVHHVDGTMPAKERKDEIEWLGENVPDNECHVLSNARCLAEGVDVPDLDAVIYLNARKSKVDIIQSVGRVMRKAKGKEYGYIIIPVAVPEGADPDKVLSSSSYDVVWDVVRALRSHDERLDAIINSAQLGDPAALQRIIEVEVLGENRVQRRKHKPTRKTGPRVEPGDHVGQPGNPEPPEGPAEQPVLEWDTLSDALVKGISAQIVKRCGTKIYWGNWTGSIATITTNRAREIDRMVNQDGHARHEFERFVQGLQDSLNPGYTDMDAIAVLAQHEVTKPIFQTLFDDKSVIDNNPIIQGLDRVLQALYSAGLPTLADNPTLKELWADVRLAAAQLESDVAKQNLIKEIYNDFFTIAFKDTADALGIVYTPVEVVDAQLHLVQRALKREFGENLGDRNVHILDGFAGTGTYLCRLIEDETLINDHDLPYKYEHDLHSNEIVPLAATIMDINIEQSYHKRIGGHYKQFPGALLTDTFQMHEDGDTLDDTVFTENSERINQQLHTPIQIIIGNPPYRAKDEEGTGNQNTKYPTLDKRIEDTYVKNSGANNNNSLYDHYIRAFRWASDRIGDSGIICFVSNGGWIEGASGAGIRRSFIKEFNSIYVYNLRGNMRSTDWRKEGGQIFGAGSQATIAITMLVRNPDSTEHGIIHYGQTPNYASRDEKFDLLKNCRQCDPEWVTLMPDRHGDWLDQRDDSFNTFVPTGVLRGAIKTTNGLFSRWATGVETSRDAWCWNYSRRVLENKIKEFVDTYNEETKAVAANPKHQLLGNPIYIKWSSSLKSHCQRQITASFNESKIRYGNYRPFCRQSIYFDRILNHRVSAQPEFFPLSDSSNIVIDMVIGDKERPFSCLASCLVPDRNYMHVGQCFPLYWYEQVEVISDRKDVAQGALFDTGNEAQASQDLLFEDKGTVKETKYVRHDAITDTGLAVFRAAYPDVRIHGRKISKEDIFYYVYGILHSTEYRTRFANNLAKELPRIPLAKDFKAFCEAGRKLVKLHTDYESVEPWAVMEVGDSANPGPTVKMKYPVKVKDPDTGKKVDDLTVLQVAENLTIHGIPLRAYEYMVNGKTAIGWLIDRYRITTDKKSGIVNDPNTFSDDPRYIVDLVEKVIRVSVETMDIVDSLPPIEEIGHPENWPDEWNA